MSATGPESRIERALRRELHRRGLRFRKHHAPIPGLRCKPDILFTKHKLAVFVDGCFWHDCPEHNRPAKTNASWWADKLAANVARDRRNDVALRDHGWTVMRLWEHEPLDTMIERVLETLPASQPAPRAARPVS